MRATIGRIAVTAVLVMGVFLAVAPPAMASTAAASDTAAAVGPASVPGSWQPYDNAHITTYQKCINRMNWRKSQYPNDSFKCQRVACAPDYWLVIIGVPSLVDGLAVSYRRDAKAACA